MTAKSPVSISLAFFYTLQNTYSIWTHFSGGMVRSSEYPLSQIATAHISHIRGYLG